MIPLKGNKMEKAKRVTEQKFQHKNQREKETEKSPKAMRRP